jgi:hypothetical protein
MAGANDQAKTGPAQRVSCVQLFQALSAALQMPRINLFDPHIVPEAANSQ